MVFDQIQYDPFKICVIVRISERKPLIDIIFSLLIDLKYLIAFPRIVYPYRKKGIVASPWGQPSPERTSVTPSLFVDYFETVRHPWIEIPHIVPIVPSTIPQKIIQMR